MSAFRVGWPALVGLLLVVLGVQSLATGIQSGYVTPLADHVRTSAIPNAIGILFLLTALAVARRIRAGLVLGLVAGALGVASGLALILLEVQYSTAGGEGAAYAVIFYVLGGGWSLIWFLYLWRLARARTDFAVAWAPADRLVAAAIVAVAVVGAGLYAWSGAAQDNAASNRIDGDQARTIVDATEFDVVPLDAAITPGAAGIAPVVTSLTIQVDLRSQTSYALAAAPTLCLTSQAVHLDPRYKSGPMCWGLPGPDDSLRYRFADLTVPQDTTTFTLALHGPGSPCPMSPGVWNAELTLSPALNAGATGIGPAPERYSRNSTFQVGDDSMVPPPSGTADAAAGCLDGAP